MILNGTQASDCAAAADALAAGELVAIPTETVYGLAADAGSDRAVAAIFQAKGRPSDHPLIVHVSGRQAAVHFANEIPDFAAALMQRFWPGPLTLILPRRHGVASAAAGGQPSVGLRCPDHPVALALLQACERRGVVGLAAPSANLFGRISPTTAAHVQFDFGDALRILDGGPCRVGIESTIVDCTRGGPVLLRPGHITAAAIQNVTGLRVCRPGEVLQFDLNQSGGSQTAGDGTAPAAPRASGTLLAHYAPKARVRLVANEDLDKQVQACLATIAAPNIGVFSRIKPNNSAIRWRHMPSRADDCAHILFASMRQLDEYGVEMILVQQVPSGPDWEGIQDRLQRAAASA